MEGQARIFVVEDEALCAFYLIMKLKDMGFIVDAVLTTGEEAVERARAFRPDLLLVDINLAGAMSGIEAAKRIKGLFDVPVIFVTGYSDAGIKRQADELRPAAFLVKPVDIRELEAAMRSVLGGSRLPAPP